MAWTTPKTWVTGEIVSAAYFNRDISKNINMLMNPPRFRSTTSVAPVYAFLGGTMDHDWERYDSDNMFSAVSSQCRINTDGLYILGSAWSNQPQDKDGNNITNSGIREIKCVVNSVKDEVYHIQLTVSQVAFINISGEGAMYFTNGMSCTFMYYQNNGGSVDIQGRKLNDAYPATWASWIGG